MKNSQDLAGAEDPMRYWRMNARWGCDGVSTDDMTDLFDAELAAHDRQAAAKALLAAALKMEAHAARTDNRFTEHVVVEAGGAMLLRDYATEIESRT